MLRFCLAPGCRLILLLLPLTLTMALEPLPGTDRHGDPLSEGAVARLGTVRFNQPNPSSVAFSPDGKVLASGGSEHKIRLWDPDTGKDKLVLEGHRGSVNCLALSADGKWLASGGQDQQVFLWDLATGKVKHRLVGHEQPLERLALSPDGKVLATSCLGGTFRLWDTATGKPIRDIPIDKGHRVLAMAFSPDSKLLAFNNRTTDGIQLEDVAEARRLRVFSGHTDNVYAVAFSPDGKTLYSGSADNTLRVWEVASGKELRRVGDGKAYIMCLAVAPNGKSLTYGTHWPGRTDGGMVHIWDLVNHRDLVPPWRADRYNVSSISYSPDGKRVVLGRNTLAIHDTATGKRLNPPTESESPIRQVEYSPDGKALAVRRQDESIELYDATTWRKTFTLMGQKGSFTALVFSPNGKHLTTVEGGFPQTILRHWDRQTGEAVQEAQLGKGMIESLTYLPDGQTLAGYFLSQQQSAFVHWNAETGKEIKRSEDRPRAWRISKLAPGGNLLASPGSKSMVDLWDLESQKIVRGFGTQKNFIWQLFAFAPDGRTLALTGGLGMEDRISIHPDIVLWETATGRERLHLKINGGHMNQIAFSRDGRLLATTSEVDRIRLWDTWTGQELGQFSGHRGAVFSLSFSPDGKKLASGGADCNVLVWDLTTLKRAKVEVKPLTKEELSRCWDDLVDIDGVRAYRTMAELSTRPEQAATWLKERLGTRSQVAPERLARLIRDLDAEEFEVREKASQELANLGGLAEGAIRAALEPKEKPSAEAARRMRDLLDKLANKSEDPEVRCLLRVVEVLERLATHESSRLLESIARQPEFAVVREAKASLERLKK